MTTQEAIDQLKYLSRLTKKEDAIYFFNRDAEAIDTVVTELEKDVIMEDKLMMILRQLYDNKINIIEAFNRITVKEETK